MQRRLQISIVVAATLYVAASLMAGCSEDAPTPPAPQTPPSDYLPRTSPENLLHNLRTAIVERNIEEHRLLFSDDFLFVSAPMWTDPELDIPESWDLFSVLAATEAMFDSPDVEEIRLHWKLGDREPPVGPGTDALIRATDVLVVVTIRDESGEPFDYVIRCDEWVFHFRKTADETPEGEPIWAIVVWQDCEGRFPWGAIMNLYM